VRLLHLSLGLVGPIRSQELKRVRGADLFIDLQQYAGKQVVLLDSQVFNISNHGGNLTSGGANFYLSSEGMDRETFRFLLTNCSGLTISTQCKMSLIVTPTGEYMQMSKFPTLTGARMIGVPN